MPIFRTGMRVLFMIYTAGVVLTVGTLLFIWGLKTPNALFLITFVALLIAETALWRYADHLLRHRERVKRMIPGYLMLGTILSAYFVLVIFYAALANFVELPFRPFLWLHLITLASVLILVILSLLYIRSTAKHDLAIKEQTTIMHDIVTSLRQVHDKLLTLGGSGNDSLAAAVHELIESFRYSDPIAPPAIRLQDRIMLEEIRLMNEELALMLVTRSTDEEFDLEPIEVRIQDLNQKLIQRNELLLSVKS